MQAQMISGFFQYEPCELQVEGDVLLVRLPASGQVLHLASVTEAALAQASGGASRLTLTAEGGRYEFLLTGPQGAGRGTQLLYELTRGCPRLELRLMDA